MRSRSGGADAPPAPVGAGIGEPLRILLWILVAIGISFPLITIRRMPTPFADSQLYASIARARQLYGVGVPTITWNSPVAVDHIPFYGPVFYDLCAVWLRINGVTLLSFRMVSLIGAVLYIGGTLLLTRQFSAAPGRTLLAAALVLLTPEVSAGAGTGAMHMLAIGFEVLALATFVRAFDRRRSGRFYAVLAGVLLLLAALTTPRSYPFIFGFIVAGCTPGIFGGARPAVRYRLVAAVLTLMIGMGCWAVLSHGRVDRWVRYVAYIFTHEDTDVAILPTAVRDFSFHWSGLLTPAAAVAGGLLAAISLKRRSQGRAEGAEAALTFLLVCAWVELVTTAVVLNYTFTIGEYLALPLLSVVVAWPRMPLPRGALAAAVCALLAVDTADLAFRAVAVAATWRARDPDPVNAFIVSFVPAGSEVVGPEQPFFFAVERSGSRYRTVSPRSWADWARWVPKIEPAATLVSRQYPAPVARNRFLIWPSHDGPPERYECAASHLVAVFEPAPAAAWTPRWMLSRFDDDPGYPPAALYRLPDGCPVGYDPTKPPR